MDRRSESPLLPSAQLHAQIQLRRFNGKRLRAPAWAMQAYPLALQRVVVQIRGIALRRNLADARKRLGIFRRIPRPHIEAQGRVADVARNRAHHVAITGQRHDVGGVRPRKDAER